MREFAYQEMFQLEEDQTVYRFIGKKGISTKTMEGREILYVDPACLTTLTKTAMRDIAHRLRKSHLQGLQSILQDPQASENDRYVAVNLLENAVISAEMVLPGCQDTGTAIVMAKKGENIWTQGCNDAEYISKGVFQAYTEGNLRYSQVAPLDMYEEINTGNNLPAQIDIYADRGSAYQFIFVAKGGGSANKTFLFQETKALLNPDRLVEFLKVKIAALGTAACPPYHLAVVIGGTSAEMNLKTVKLASIKYYDTLPITGDRAGRAYRDLALEKELHTITRGLGLGAQFGGKYFCHDVRVVRLPRHGASCPVGIGVSCSADRNVLGKITRNGMFLERLETDPQRYLPKESTLSGSNAVPVNLDEGMDKVRYALSQYPVKTRVALTGKIVVARDIAHAKLYERLERGEPLPDYFKNHIVYYAGPAKRPDGYASGSFGPTTAGRMDAYVASFQRAGGSLVMLAKGNRSRQVTDACKKYGGFYLGSIGGAAAILAKNCIARVEPIAYPELGMEAIFMITVVDFPAFIVIDDKGNDLFASLW